MAPSQLDAWKVTVRGEAKPVEKKPIAQNQPSSSVSQLGEPLFFDFAPSEKDFQPPSLNASLDILSFMCVCGCMLVCVRDRQRERDLCLECITSQNDSNV